MLIVCCEKCKYTDLGEEFKESKCPRCGGKMLSLGVSPTQWNEMNQEEKDSCINKIIEDGADQEMVVSENVTTKTADPHDVPQKTMTPVDSTNTRLVSGICPQCGGKIKVDKTQDAAVCEHCGTPFIVDKAISIVNNNIQMGEEHIDEFVDKIKGRDATLSDRINKAIPYFNRYFKAYQNIEGANTEKKDSQYWAEKGFTSMSLVGVFLIIASTVLLFLTLSFVKDGDTAGVAFSLAGFLIAGVPGLILLICSIVKRKKAILCIQQCNQDIEQSANEAANCYKYISTNLPELPKEYYYPQAINYIQKVFLSNRADNMRQALAMLDEQTHRWKMEAMAKDNLVLQQQQKAALNAIWWQNFLR